MGRPPLASAWSQGALPGVAPVNRPFPCVVSGRVGTMSWKVHPVLCAVSQLNHPEAAPVRPVSCVDQLCVQRCGGSVCFASVVVCAI